MLNAVFVILFTALLVIVQACGSKKFGSWFNPITFFCGLWSLTAAVSNLGLYGYYTPSAEVDLIMLAGILSAFVFCMGLDFRGGSFKQEKFPRTVQYQASGYRACVVCCLVAISMLLIKLPQALDIIANSGWAYLRLAYYANPANYDGPAYMSSLDSYAQLYIAQPILNAALYLAAWLLFKGDKKAFGLLGLSLIGQLLLVIVSAGRGPLISVFKVLILALLSFSKKGEILNTVKRIMTPGRAIAAFVVVCFLLAITSGRSSEGASLGQTLYQYYFTGPVLMTQLLQQRNSFWTINETFMFGWATFGFLANVPLTIGLILGLSTKTSVYWIASYLTSGNLEVGDGLYSNAMCTCFYDFLMDWGYAGAVIGPILIVFVSYILIMKLRKKPDDPFIGSMMLYWLVLLIGTTFRWEAVDITPTCVLFFAWVFTRRMNLLETNEVLGEGEAISAGAHSKKARPGSWARGRKV